MNILQSQRIQLFKHFNNLKWQRRCHFLQSIKSSQGKSFELYPVGHIAEMTCMCIELFNEKFINNFN